MNAVEIADAVTELSQQLFDPAEFPFQFLSAFDNSPMTIKRLRAPSAASTNKSDIAGAVLQRNNIHILVTPPGKVSEGLVQLQESPATAKAKARFLLATDGMDFQAEDRTSGDVIACEYVDFADHFGFFLPLAGIETVAEIKENAFDIKATGRLNRLYLELLKDNPQWKDTEALRHEMNRFLVKLVFCFYAEDTDIFPGHNLFSQTVEQMSDRNSSNTHNVISTIFQAMNVEDNSALPVWVSGFPYVNGGLFAGNNPVPRFSRIARTYLFQIGKLDWKQINPDIFGSMIQAVANDDERGNLGMHYTSVPNILKVLNPLFLDDLKEKLEEAGDNARKLLNLKKRIARIRVFDPACGSGNFLVIAYKQLREIENEIHIRRDTPGLKSSIPLTNFRGIEIQDFAAEIARLSLVIAEFQCNARYLGNREAIHAVLPLSKQNWIICGNALRLDWQTICPPQSTAVRLTANDLFDTPLEQSEIDFENEGGETYICGNPPYLGGDKLDDEQSEDLKQVFGRYQKKLWRLDYVSAWFIRAAEYCAQSNAIAAFVATNSICQGSQVAMLWPYVQQNNCQIVFAHQSFKWRNLARHNAGVTVVIVGISAQTHPKRLFSEDENGQSVVKLVLNINGYLLDSIEIIVKASRKSLFTQIAMIRGSMPTDGGNLVIDGNDYHEFIQQEPLAKPFIRQYVGSEEFINGKRRYCLWLVNATSKQLVSMPLVSDRVEKVRAFRLASKAKETREYKGSPALFRQIQHQDSETILIIPRVSSENRDYLPCGLLGPHCIVGDSAFALYDAPLWTMALISSRLHLAWIGAICGKLKTDFRYSNTLGWNTFPIPTLTRTNRDELTRSTERILEIREAHFPKTIADLYARDAMPEDLKEAHDMNDEIVERIYIGRRFKNDSERLQKLFSMYADLLERQATEKKETAPKRRKKSSDQTELNMENRP